MSYIKFDKSQLVNLEYSLTRELLRTSRSGSYASSTIINCNTRRSHGKLVVPQPDIDGKLHVLLSTMDETVVQHESHFNLGIHKYPGGVYRPGGHKYIRDFESEPIPTLIYRVGGVLLKKESLFTSNTNRFMTRYTLLDAHSDTMLQFRPFLAFRGAQSLSKANNYINKKYKAIQNGAQFSLYDSYTPLNIQLSKEAEYIHVPEWYYNIEYYRDQERGFDYQEDLFVPGYFEAPIKKGESIVLIASLDEVNPDSLKNMFYRERNKRTPRDSFRNCLENSAEQFVVKNESGLEIVTGYPWLSKGGRDTFIAAPGLLLSRNKNTEFKKVVKTMIKRMEGPVFPSEGDEQLVPAADAALWFVWSLQQLALKTKDQKSIWKQYGETVKRILKGYRNQEFEGTSIRHDGLIETGKSGCTSTWMNARVNNRPVTPRCGAPVEINALWYNALAFAIDAAEKANDAAFANDWKRVFEKAGEAFNSVFWNEEKGYLADYVNNDGANWSIRPNMIFATSLAYSPLNEAQKREVLKTVHDHLLTPMGLRSLSPRHPDYKGEYAGNQQERDLAYHQGSVWPWLLAHFAEGYLNIYGKQGLQKIKELYEGFEDEMLKNGVGSISEVYSGNPPHNAGGNISQAWNVAELIRLGEVIAKFEQNGKKDRKKND